jgi:hypothetical protein
MSEEQQLAVQIPWIEVDVATKLPSRGIPYPEGTKVKYRTYSFGEVKMSAAVSGGAPQIVQIMENTMKGIETTGISKDQLTFLDVLYLGVLRKVSTLRNGEYEVPFSCTECGTVGKHKFNENQLDFQSLSEDITQLPLVVTLAGREVHFGPLRVREFLALQRGRYQKDIGGEPDRVSLIALMITNMDFKESYALLYGLRDPDDIDAVDEVDKMLMHDLKPLTAVCQAVSEKNGLVCNAKNEIVLQGREQLIRPFRTGDKPVRSRISIGVPQRS